ncbi:MAG: homoserine dehydrogenase [Acidobacteriota bacterium]
MTKKEIINIGFLGFGTVASGTLRILQEHYEELSRRLDCHLRVKAICSPNIAKRDTSWVEASVRRLTDPLTILTDPEIDIVVEAIGGREPANNYIRRAMECGKSVITANKLLLAVAGAELAKLAATHNVSLGIEAAVAGGIPVLDAIRTGLAGERIESIHGILNGTANYILTEMEKSCRSFDELLADAQRLGYAEADPTLDIEGLDARDKLAVLVMLCFGVSLDPATIPTTGITRLHPDDFLYAHHIGYTIRLICTARRLKSGELAISVSPTLVPRKSILAKVEGVFNALLVTGVAGGCTMYYGRGAGGGPTGLAIVSDIVKIARELSVGVANLSPPFNYRNLTEQSLASTTAFTSAYSLRFVVDDRPGIISQLAAILARHDINIDAVLQEKGYQNKRQLPFVITLDEAPEKNVQLALAEMNGLDFLVEPPLALPIENI